MEKTINRQQMQAILDQAPQGVDKKALIDKFVSNGFTVEGVNDKKESGFVDRLKESLVSRDAAISEGVKKGGIEGFAESVKGLTGMGADLIDNTTQTIDNALTGGKVLPAIGEALAPVVQPVMQQVDKVAPEGTLGRDALDAAANITGIAGAITGTGAIKNVTKTAAKNATKSIQEAGQTLKNVNLQGLTKGIQDIGKPVKTADEAIGQIAQGTTDAISPLKTALSVLDTTKVKTFADLQGEINTAIPALARKVDSELLKDANRYNLADLELVQTSKAGKTVKTDYVSKGLKELKDYYTSVGDDVATADIQDLIKKAKNEGLTRYEVNNIARLHGRELNAFNANGQLASGVTKQAIENTRSGLKQVARKGLGGAEAKLVDSQLSALYDTSKLIDKNVEAVNKLKQRIQERGLIEKIGYNFSKYADILTGGTIRGFVGGILPRGAGYKVMNALDVEDALRANLDIVEKALKSTTDKELLNNLNQLKSSVDDSSLPKASLTEKTKTKTTKGASGKMSGFAQVSKDIPKELQPLAEEAKIVKKDKLFYDYSDELQKKIDEGVAQGKRYDTEADFMRDFPDFYTKYKQKLAEYDTLKKTIQQYKNDSLADLNKMRKDFENGKFPGETAQTLEKKFLEKWKYFKDLDKLGGALNIDKYFAVKNGKLIDLWNKPNGKK